MGSIESGWYGGTTRPERRLNIDDVAEHGLRIGVRDVVSRLAPEMIASEEPIVLKTAWNDGQLGLDPIIATPSWLCTRLCPDWYQRVELEPIPARFGGVQWMFRCCGCARPRRWLYAFRPGLPVKCRVCYRLSYPSQQEWNTEKRTGRLAAWQVEADEYLAALGRGADAHGGR